MLSKVEQVAELRKARASRAEAAAGRTRAVKAKAPRKGRAASKGRSTAAAGRPEGARPGSKQEKIAKLLRRPEGCTAADILKACHWSAVSVPPHARALGIKLRCEKEGRTLRYWAV